MLALGVTYDDLIAMGVHPVFLDQLFALIKPQSPIISPQQMSSLPQPTAATDTFKRQEHSLPIQIKPIAQPTDIVADVDKFLDNLKPTISTPNTGEDSKKRGLPSHTSDQPCKRRAFGSKPPKELVIDISDDEDEDNPPALVEPAPPVKFSNRPSLKQQVSIPGSLADQ